MANDKINEYCEDHSSPESEVLRQISRDTHANLLKPRMLSGHLQGRLLSMISQILQPVNILEIGAYTGYSAICLAEGLAKGGKLITIEADEELESRIRKNIELAELSDQIELKMGNALDVIPTLDAMFDLVFIDADKLNYIKYYDLVIEKLNVGGLIISDNVLWDGKVADQYKNDATTKLLREFNAYVHNDTRTKNVLLPIRDGLLVSRKIK
ncbi:O-methyltransferase [Lacihabitans soyangensis]|uniref:O-methyltransferase n=1 Tax=Lacihabitans soyangensis TaxID=869394 RepID=A0AAE3H0D3_9BACT|nr:O-methyltransferase [Lacihabitans soyangensis]MCP9762583.1 O-methyltransferase [Lacihabitans soyangensis]